MDRSPILFRCDGNGSTGWDAFYQCLTYAAALQRRRRPAYMMGQIEPFPLLSQVTRGGNEYVSASHAIGSPEDCDETIRQIRKLNVAAVIIPTMGLTTDYLREIVSTGVTVVALDYEANLRFPSRLVINPLLSPGKKSYTYERGTQLLLGRRYPLVRSVFRRQRAVRSIDPQAPFRALIAFGDDDFEGQSLVRTKELLAIGSVEKITVMIRSHHHQLDELRMLGEEYKGRLEVLTEPSELNTRLPRTHFALTSGNCWSMEVACVGIPQLLITQNAQFDMNAKMMEEEGAAVYLGPCEKVSTASLRSAVLNLLEDPVERIGMARCARQLVDGRGPDRLVTGLEIMLRSSVSQREGALAA